MKTHKLFITIMVFLLATGAGSASAIDICEGGIIEGGTFESVTLVGQSCILTNVRVLGDVTVLNAGTFWLQNSDVEGKIRVEGSGSVDLQDVQARNILVRGNETVQIGAFVTAARFIRVIGNNVVLVVANAAPIINCRDNIRTVGLKNRSGGGNNCDVLGLDP